MRKRNSYTVLEQAVAAVPEFETMLKKLSQQVTLRGQSKSTTDNYSRRIDLFVIHFNRLPEQVSEDEINDLSPDYKAKPGFAVCPTGKARQQKAGRGKRNQRGTHLAADRF